MSRMMLRSSGKPPLARSPIRLRSRRKALEPTVVNNTIHTPPGSVTKSQLPTRNRDIEKSELRPEYHTISCELRALAKMVNQECGAKIGNICDDGILGGQRSPLFERGRFYDEYSARRNERLKRKKVEMEGYEKKHSYDLGVRVESAKKRDSGKLDSRRKAAVVAAASTPVVERRESRTQTSRYLLRSGSVKENKKPPLPVMMNVEKSVGVSERKVGVRRIRKA